MNLKEIRRKRNLTQQIVADYLGSSSVVYSRYETGSRQPSIETLLRLANLFGVTVDYLLGRQDIEDSTLSAYEVSLVAAARNADERARGDALDLLIAHSTSCQKDDLK
jgi:transcriptional regulator with XRE-family HTH domain